MAIECHDCGVASELEDQFQQVKGAFSFQPARSICPRCAYKRRLSVERGAHLGMFGTLVLAAALIAWRPDVTAGWVALYAGLFALCMLPMVILHEAGHALAARLLGMRLLAVVLGMGPVRWRRRLFGIPIEWRAVPAGGTTFAPPTQAEGARWKMAVLALAGPAANVVGVLAVSRFIPVPFDAVAWQDPAVALAASFGAANLLGLGMSLYPWHFVGAHGLQVSDGMLVWNCLRADAKVVESWVVGRYVVEGAIARDDGRLDEAFRILRVGLDAHPGDAQLVMMYGAVLIDLGRGDEARPLYCGMLDEQQGEHERAIALNNIAWCDFLAGRDALLDEALQCSGEALDKLAWEPSSQNTRAAVLVWAGRPEEALPLVEASLVGLESPRDAAAVFCVQCMALADLGSGDEAKASLERARALDAGCHLLERAAAAIR
jgi:tetratricopeptide (TPR) repeat protein